jgi:hypothetical protein
MKKLLIATLALFPLSASAVPYDDTVTFSASAACAELTGVKYPSEVSKEEWDNYLKCIQVLNYFDTKY